MMAANNSQKNNDAKVILSRSQLEQALRENDPAITKLIPRYDRHQSAVQWNRFRQLLYNDVAQDMVQCLDCEALIYWRPRTGSGALLRHQCGGNGRRKRISEMMDQYRDLPTFTQETQEEEEGSDEADHSVTESPMFVERLTVERSDTTKEVDEEERKRQPRDELAAIQAKMVCKDLRGVDLFDDESFKQFCERLIALGAQFGKVDAPRQLSREELLEKVLPEAEKVASVAIIALGRRAKVQFTYEIWPRSPSEAIFALYGHVIDDQFRLKRAALGVEVVEPYQLREDHIYRLVEESLRQFVVDVPKYLEKSVFTIDEADLLETRLQENQKVPCAIGQIEAALNHVLNKHSDIQGIVLLDKFLRVSFWSGTRDTLLDTLLPLIEQTAKNTEEDLITSISSAIQTDRSTAIDLIRLLKHLQLLLSLVEDLVDPSDPTLSKVFLWKKKLVAHLTQLSNEGPCTALGASLLSPILDQHLRLHDALHHIAVFLNPKFKHLNFMTPEEAKHTHKLVLHSISAALEEQNLDVTKFQMKTVTDPAPDVFAEFMETKTFTLEDSCRNEIRHYVESKLTGNGDLLPYWRNSNYENLRKLARRVLSIPAVARRNFLRFTVQGKVVRQRRANLNLDEIPQVLFLYENF